jgi:hypothetical protein
MTFETLRNRAVFCPGSNSRLRITAGSAYSAFCSSLQNAEFERDVIRERTHAGLSAARARGRKGGRPKGVPINAESTACAAETLYREGKLSSQEIASRLQISKSTLYSYLRHRGVPIGPYRVLDKRRPNRRNEHA